MLISVERTGKHQVKPRREIGGCSRFVILFLAKKKSLTKTDRCTGELLKKKPNAGSPYSGRFLLTASLRRQRMSMYFSIVKVAISLIIPANSRNVSKPLRLYPNLRPPRDLVTSYQWTSWNMTKEQNHQLSRGGSLKFRISCLAWLESNIQ
jgi:hypothetical protein